MGVGECAGEVVSLAEFGFTEAETEAFEAQLLLDDGKYQEADEKAYEAMLTAARTLVQLQWLDVPNDPNDDRRTSSARGSSTRRSSGTRTTPASSPTTCSPATRRPGHALHAGHGPQAGRGGEPLHRRRPQGPREVAGAAEAGNRPRRATVGTPACLGG